MSALLHFRIGLAAAAVDVDAGIIRGVSVITVGPALGHYDWATGKPMYADARTLEQVMQCAKTYVGGLKVKLDHGGGAGDIIGYLTGFRIDGDKLRADLNLLSTSPHRGYVLELATKIPDTVGLSIAFAGSVDEAGDRVFARCDEIYSADLVSEPAANPDGLFDARAGGKAVRRAPAVGNTQHMDEITKALAEMMAKLDTISGALSKLALPPSVPAESGAQDDEAMMERAVDAALKKFAATFGVKPTAASAEAPNPTSAAPKKFEELVKGHAEYTRNKPKAITETVVSHPDEYKAFLARVQSGGEVLTF